MSARVLLVNPPFYRLLGSHYNANSLGIAYIASYLNKYGHDAWLYNADFLNETEFSNLTDLYDGFVDYKKFFENKNHSIWTEVVENIIKFKIDRIKKRIFSVGSIVLFDQIKGIRKQIAKINMLAKILVCLWGIVFITY